jgi:steroid delta-isomerase-like uncharacterized protein
MRSFVPAILMMPLLAGSAAPGEDQGSAEGQLLSSYEAAWSAHDAEKVAAYFTNDATYEDVTLGEVHRGRSAIKAFAQGTFDMLPGYTIKPRSLVLGQGSAAVEWVMSGTYRETGKSFSVRGVSVMQFENGKIRHNSDYWNMAEFQRQTGVPGNSGA